MTQADKPSRAQAEIDANLKRAYTELSNQEIPDRFKDLLSQLRATTPSDGTTSGSEGTQ